MMKVEPIHLTTPYPSLLRMARTLGASKSEVKQAKRLVRKVVAKKVTLLQTAKRAAP